MLEVSRATTDPITAHAVGTVEGTHQRVVTYTFTRQGVSTGVVADVSERAPLSGGQVETISLNDNGAVYGFFQKQLNRLKETVE